MSSPFISQPKCGTVFIDYETPAWPSIAKSEALRFERKGLIVAVVKLARLNTPSTSSVASEHWDKKHLAGRNALLPSLECFEQISLFSHGECPTKPKADPGAYYRDRLNTPTKAKERLVRSLQVLVGVLQELLDCHDVIEGSLPKGGLYLHSVTQAKLPKNRVSTLFKEVPYSKNYKSPSSSESSFGRKLSPPLHPFRFDFLKVLVNG